MIQIKNDKGALERLLSKINFLVGFNNYQVDDKLLASILKDINPYSTLGKIENKERFTLSIQNPITLDLKQELADINLKEVQGNLSYDISKEDIETDLKTIQFIFKEREDYFTSKFEVVKEFKLPVASLKKTRVNMASDVLKSRKGSDVDRLKLTFDKQLQIDELPKQVLSFYESVQEQYQDGEDVKALEKQKFTYKIAGLDHVYGFGGLHAAKTNYVDEGYLMQIDVKAYYPSLIINNAFLSDAALERYKRIYNTRQQLEANKDTKEQAYKLITNIVYGGLKSKWTNLYNPKAANNVVVNGQLILTHLNLLLENFCELIQTNTDGIIIKYDLAMKDSILKIIQLFEEHYNLDFNIDDIKKIAQRDVNNYVIQKTDGEIIARGIFSKYEGGDFERNSLTIIDKALVDYYINGIKPNRTIMNAYKNNEFERFQNIVKAGSSDGMALEIKDKTLFEGTFSSSFKVVESVNRVFASRNELDGAVYKVKNGREKQYSKAPYTSENSFIHNGSLSNINKRRIDLNWYIQEVNNMLF